ncbi:CehA/McbA family metallohydrolase [candidate division KSB1 bacterium]
MIRKAAVLISIIFMLVIFLEERALSFSDAPQHKITVRILDENGTPTPARVRFSGLNSVYYAPDGHSADFPIVNWGEAGGDVILDYDRRFAYIDGEFNISLPKASVVVEVVKGFTYRIVTDTVQITNQTETIDIQLERWFRFPDDNWFSGDNHIHFITPKTAVFQMKAEDLNVCDILTTDVTTDQSLFIGKPDPASEERQIVYVNQEYREDRLGHINLLNLKKLIMPVATMREHQHPLNLESYDEVHEQGGFAVLAHFSQNQGFEWPLGIVMNKVDAVELLGCILPFESATSGMWHLIPDHQGNNGLRLWYRILNCGFKITALGGTDLGSNRVNIGANRVYAYVEDEFTYENWIAALRAGRGFITNSPFLFLSVNDKMPGDSIHLKKGEEVNIKADVWCQFPLDRLEIIVNGEVVAEHFISPNREHSSLSLMYKPKESCWITARAYESPLPYKKRGVSFSRNRFRGYGPTLLNSYHGTEAPELAFAHTNPLYVTMEGKPIRSRKDAQYYAHFLENAMHYLRTQGVFASEDKKQEVLQQFEEGRQKFLDLSNY